MHRKKTTGTPRQDRGEKKKKQEGQMSNCMTVYGCHKKKNASCES